MTTIVANCPRCGAQQMTFNLKAQTFRYVRYNWKRYWELYCICRSCLKGTILIVSQKEINDEKVLAKDDCFLAMGISIDNFVEIEGFISIKDQRAIQPPEHLPENIDAAFKEASTCLTVGCWNASATMFRLCIDLATRALVPDENGPNNQTKRSLGLRLVWLFENGLLPRDLQGLSACIQQDGNDGAHDGTLTKADAEDLLDFSTALLNRLYTEPARLAAAEIRRAARRDSRK